MKIETERQPRLELLVEELEDRLCLIQEAWNPELAQEWAAVQVTVAKMQMVIEQNRKRRVRDRADRSGLPVGPVAELPLDVAFGHGDRSA